MPFPWQLFLSAVAAGAPALAEARANRRRMEELLRGQALALARERRGQTLLGEEIAALERSDPAAEQRQSLAAYQAALARARAQGGASLPTGLGGEQYRSDTAAATQAGIAQGASTADLVSRIDAPSRQREVELQRFARTGITLGDLGRRAQTEQFLARLRAERQRVNPWVQVLASMAQQIARNYEGSSGGDGLEEIDVTTLPSPRDPTTGAPIPLRRPIRRE